MALTREQGGGSLAVVPEECPKGGTNDNFKKCEAVGFCQRHRAIPDGDGLYIAVLSRVGSSEIGLNIPVFNIDKRHMHLNLRITALSREGHTLDGVEPALRFTVTEPSTKFARMTMDDVLDNPLHHHTMEVVDQQLSGDGKTVAKITAAVANSDIQVHVHASPFRIEIVDKGTQEVISVVNGHGLMDYEETRPYDRTDGGMPESNQVKGNNKRRKKKVVRDTEDGQFVEEVEAQDDSDVNEQPPAKLQKTEDGPGRKRRDPLGDREYIVNRFREDWDLLHQSTIAPKPWEKRSHREDDRRVVWSETWQRKTDWKLLGPRSVGVDISWPNAVHVYGANEHTLKLALPSTRRQFDGDTSGPGICEPIRFYNLDVFEYQLDSPAPLYKTVPFVTAVSKNGRSSGVLWLNGSETVLDIAKFEAHADPGLFGKWANGFFGSRSSGDLSKVDHITTHLFSETNAMDFFIFVGPTIGKVMRQHAEIAGTTQMPALWSLGFHQCRWNYVSVDDVLQVSQGFSDNDLPMDTMWLDIEHTDHKKYMTWDQAHFRNAGEMMDKLDEEGRHLVVIVDPHIKKDSQYHVYSGAKEQDFFVTQGPIPLPKEDQWDEPESGLREAANKTFEGDCWPGLSSWPDFMRQDVREWWGNLFALDVFPQARPNMHIWNDMNEPSVFSGPEITMPKDVVHGNWKDWMNAPASEKLEHPFPGIMEHREIHNAFGYYFHKATYDGILARSDHTERAFVLSRAAFTGTQRIGPVWNGDNAALWSHLQVSIPMILSSGISGIANVGADVGGFFGDTEPELLVRWHQTGAFYPFMRAHAHIDTKRREPWRFGDEVTGLIRDALRLRYSLLPYIYTLFHESSATLAPVMRPLWYEFTDELVDTRTKLDRDTPELTLQTEFMLGEAYLCAPVLEKGMKLHTVYLPGSATKTRWYDAWTGQLAGSGGSTITLEVFDYSIPFFQRSGTVVPRKMRARRSTTQMTMDPYTLFIALDANGHAKGVFYGDDGKTYHPTQFVYTGIEVTSNKGNVTIHNSPARGSAPASHNFEVEKLVIYGYTGPALQKVEVVGRDVESSVDVEDHGTLQVDLHQVSLADTFTVRLFA
eukprot:Clim_evm97s25 gene=Clim_evmTU97s25